MSCALTLMLLLRVASATACSAVNGGATTISTSVTSFTRLRSSFAKTTASWTVLNIFQLPAIRGILIMTLSRIWSSRHLVIGSIGAGQRNDQTTTRRTDNHAMTR